MMETSVEETYLYTIRRTSETTRDKCRECGGSVAQYDGEYVCDGCGLVHGKIIDSGHDYRAFTPEEEDNKRRTGSPISILKPEKGLPTVIMGYRDSSGRTISPSTQLEMHHLRKQQQYKTPEEKTMNKALSEMDRIAYLLNIPSVITEEAAKIYKQLLEKNLVQGRTINSTSAAALLTACKIMRNRRTIKNIASVSRISGYKKKRCNILYGLHSMIVFELNLSKSIQHDPSEMTRHPLRYVSPIAYKLNLSEKTQAIAREIIEEVNKMKLHQGKDPRAVAAAAVYVAGGLTNNKKTQKDVAEVSDITEVTIRNRYKQIMDILNIKIKL